MENVQIVAITHVIDPSRFYCRNLATADADRREIMEVELKLKEFADTNKSRFYDVDELKIGDWVGYYCEEGKKWIRCQVDKIALIAGGDGEQQHIFLWTVDYGFPFFITKLSKLFSIPKVLQHPSSKIFVAGLSAMPVETSFDHINVRMQAKIGECWTDRAVKTFKECLANANTICFVPSTKVSHREVMIGDLDLTDTADNFVQMTRMLVEKDLALIPPHTEFSKCYKKLMTNNIERWNDFRRAGGVLRLPPDVLMSPVTLDFPEDSDGSSSISESYQDAINRKVRDWQKRNDCCNSSDLGSEVGTPPPSVTSFMQAHLSSRMKKIVAATKSNIERKQMQILNEMKMKTLNSSQCSETKSSQEKRAARPVFVAAGAAYGEAKSHRSWKAKSSRDLNQSDDLGSLVNEEFISASQVGCAQQEDGFD